jgi:hypothetical protein
VGRQPTKRFSPTVLRYSALCPKTQLRCVEKPKRAGNWADVDQSAERKALWLKRADQWEQLAIEAEKHPPKSTEA